MAGRPAGPAPEETIEKMIKVMKLPFISKPSPKREQNQGGYCPVPSDKNKK